MSDTLTWASADEIGYQLYEAHADTHPLEIGFVQLHKWVTELEKFEDDAQASNEKILEAIQMAWYDEWRVDNDD